MKWNIISASEKFLEMGLYLDESEYISYSTKMNCHDKDGYKYYTNMDFVCSGKYPSIVNQSNPYSIENINQFLKNNNCNTITIENEYINSKTKMNFICGNCEEVFQTTWNEIYNHKRYCNFCAKSKRYDGLKDYTRLISEYCKQNGYELLTNYIHRSFDDFKYICLKHKEYGIQHSYYDRMINCGQGCYWCGIEKRGIKHRKSENEYEELAIQKGFTYKGCTYPLRNNGCKKAMLQLICNKHPDKGIQNIDYQNLKKNIIGCIYCHGYYRTQEDLQTELNQKNMDIDIITYKDYQNVVAKCRKCSKTWNAKGTELNQGRGCPYCKASRYEKIIRKLLDNWGYNYEIQYCFDDCKDQIALPFDFYLTDYNIAIETDGEQHYYPVQFGGISMERAIEQYEKTVYHDNIKDNYCIDYNIPLIRLPYWEFDDDEYLYHIFDSFKTNGLIITE